MLNQMRYGFGMKFMRYIGMMALFFATISSTTSAAPVDAGPSSPGKFDYYVLALSWEPGFCATHPGNKSNECSSPNGFALHGLWPQFEGERYPTNCSDVALSDADRTQWAGIFADPTMIDHEWSKHGTCSGLPAATYFSLAQSDESAVVIPAAYTAATTLRASDTQAITQAFLAANPGMVVSGISVGTQHGFVTEVDICVTKAGAFRAC